tara:strand:+ start:209 stop:457 length:249 start_codon:yes stop_codon:yes gene_type:complete
MKKLKPIILPVLLVLILGIQLYAYFNGTMNYAIFGVVFALTPAAIRDLFPNLSDKENFKYFKWLMVVLAIIVLVLGLRDTFW